MTTCFRVLPIAAVLWTAFSFPLYGQTVCADREAIMRELRLRYDERIVGAGITFADRVLEIFAAPTGSWTAVVTTPGGPSCIASHGSDWQAVPTPAADRTGSSA